MSTIVSVAEECEIRAYAKGAARFCLGKSGVMGIDLNFTKLQLRLFYWRILHSYPPPDDDGKKAVSPSFSVRYGDSRDNGIAHSDVYTERFG